MKLKRPQEERDIIKSDRGGQYAGTDCQYLLKGSGLIYSINREGN